MTATDISELRRWDLRAGLLSEDVLADARRLRQAIGQREIEVAYQPVVDLASGSVVAVEALARWRHPPRG